MDHLEPLIKDAEESLAKLKQALSMPMPEHASQQKQQVANCEKLAQRARHAIDTLRLEVRALPREQTAHVEHRLVDMDGMLKSCRTQLSWRRCDIGRKSDTERLTPEADEDMTVEQVVAEADRIQDASGMSLERTLRTALEAERLGTDILTTMEAQEEQLDNVAGDVETIKENIKRSKKIITSISRGAASDRLVKIICVMIACCVMVMIALAATGNDGGTLYVPDEVKVVN